MVPPNDPDGDRTSLASRISLSRRRALAIGSGSLAGCLDRSQEQEAAVDSPSRTTSSPQEPRPESGAATETPPEPIAIEAEAFESTNFRNTLRPSPAQKTEGASNGKLLKLTTPEDPPDGGYVTTYEITAPAAGYYAVDVIGNPLGESWASPYEFRVNDGEWRSPTFASSENVFDAIFDYQAGTVRLEKGTNTFSVRVTERRQINDRDRYVFSFDRFRFRPAPLRIDSIVGSAPMNVFTAAEPIELTVGLNHPTTAEQTVHYEVLAYDGETVRDGTTTVGSGGSDAAVSFDTLPLGHYTVQAWFADDPDRTWSEFLGVVTPVEDRGGTDHPFASMTGVSQHITADERDDFSAVLRRGGISMVREISLRWNDKSAVNPGRGEFDWSFFDQWLPPLGEGTDVCFTSPNSPSWTRSHEHRAEIPDDLFTVYDFVGATASRYRDVLSGWETHNEPELHGIRPHRLGPHVKMSAIAIAASSTDLPVVMPGWSAFSLMPGPNELMVTALENDLAPYVDVYNHHAYQHHEPNRDLHPTEQPAIQYHRALQERYGLGELPLWITEAGLRVKTADAGPMSADQRADQARFVVTSAITAVALGVEKYFWYIYHNNPNQNTKYGAFSETHTPRPALVAYGVLADVVAEGTYAGVLEDVPEAVTGHVFERADGGEVAVCWSSEETTVELPISAGTVRETETMGDSTERSAGGSLSVDLGPNPIYLSSDESLGLSTAPYPAASQDRALETGHDPEVANRPAGRTRPVGDGGAGGEGLTTAQRVVFAPEYPTGSLETTETVAERFRRNGSRMRFTAGRVHPVTLQVYNANDEPVTVDLRGAAGDGWEVRGGSPSVEVGSEAMTTVEFELGPATDDEADTTVVDQRPAFVEFWGTVGGESVPRSTSLVAADPVLRATFEGTTPALEVDLHNDGDRDRQITTVEWQSGTNTGTARPGTTVPSNGARTVSIPVEAPDRYYTPQDTTLEVTFDDGSSRVFRDALAFSPVPTGSAADLPAIRAPEDGYVAMNAVALYDGPDDVSARTNLWQTGEALHVRARVTDDVYFPDAASGNHQRVHDTFVIAIEGYALAADDYADGGQSLSMWTGPESDGDDVTVDAADVSITRDEAAGETRFDVTIPWSLLDAIDRTTPSTVTLWTMDDDGATNEGRVWWSGDVDFLDGQPP
jgi:hypothetical protein